LVLALGVSALRIYEMDVLRPPSSLAPQAVEAAVARIEPGSALSASQTGTRNAAVTSPL